MDQMNTFSEEFVQPILPCLLLLKNCNILLFDDYRSFRVIWPYIYIVPCMIAFYGSISIYFFSSLNQGIDLDELVIILPIFVVITQTILKALIVVSNMKEIRRIILRLGELWRTKDLTDVQISKKNVLLKRLKFCYTAFYWMNMVGSWQYLVTPLFETITRKYVLNQELILRLPFRCYYSFDPSSSWGVYSLTYIFEIYSMFRVIFSYLGSEFLMITLCSHLATEFTLLQEDLLHLKPVHKNNIRLDNTNEHADFNTPVDETGKLRDLIRRHQILIALTQDLDNIFNKMIFVNLSSASITVCFFAFSAKVAKDIILLLNNFIGAIASMLPIYNLCKYGEILKNASEGIAGAAYSSLWYTGSKDYKTAIRFIIMRSQKPCSLTSLKYNPIALSTFTTVLSTTWSYFSLATSLYDENS